MSSGKQLLWDNMWNGLQNVTLAHAIWLQVAADCKSSFEPKERIPSDIKLSLHGCESQTGTCNTLINQKGRLLALILLLLLADTLGITWHAQALR